MSDFYETWSLVRQRFNDAVLGLNIDQLNYRLHPRTLTIGESCLHVAGVEVSFITQLLGREPEGLEINLKKAATDGVVNDNPFPFEGEITPEQVTEALSLAYDLVKPAILDPDAFRAKSIKSALGPIIDGTGACARLSYHPGYHQAQVHMIAVSPGFPK